jgi:NADH-quinone oxidoreductase subunit A
MNPYLAAISYTDFGPFLVLLSMVLVFVLANLALTHLLGPSRQGDVKGTVYESGVNPFGSTRRRFNVRFYVVAMTFLVFDVEIVFLYPWGATFASLDEQSELGPLFLGRILFFVLTTLIAFAYAWRKGVFRYD